MMRRHLTARAALVLIGATLPTAVLVGCGGDDDTAGQASATRAASMEEAPTQAPSTQAASTEAVSTQVVSTQAVSTESSAGVEASGASPGEAGATGASGAASDCPTPTQVGEVVGVELELDPLSVTGDGLGNCLYSQLGAFSDDPPPDPVLVWVSLQDVSPVQAAAGLEDVAGVGQEATWSGTELSVWTGELGIIVLFPGGKPPGDPLDAATATATLFM